MQDLLKSANEKILKGRGKGKDKGAKAAAYSTWQAWQAGDPWSNEDPWGKGAAKTEKRGSDGYASQADW